MSHNVDQEPSKPNRGGRVPADAVLRGTILLLALAAIGTGLHLVAGPGWALVACGGLIWRDLTKETEQHERHSKHPDGGPAA